MIDKLDYELLITPQEAVRLTAHRPVEDMYTCEKIQAAAMALHQGRNPRDTSYWVLCSIWNGGRIQGIREERRKKAGRVRKNQSGSDSALPLNC